MAYHTVIDDDIFDKLRFVNKIGIQTTSQPGEGTRTYTAQDTGAVILWHGENGFDWNS